MMRNSTQTQIGEAPEPHASLIAHSASGANRPRRSERLDHQLSPWPLSVPGDDDVPQALLLWLLRYPLLRTEDLAAVTGYSRQRTHVQLTQLEAAGAIEAVRVPALGLSGARLYHVSAVGMKLLADVHGDAIWRAAHLWGADESGLLRLLPRAPALVPVQTVAMALITGAGSVSASPARAERSGLQQVCARTEWAWERDYRFMLAGRAAPDGASTCPSSRSMCIDAYVRLRVCPSADETSLSEAVPATGRTDRETAFGLFVLNAGDFLDPGRPQALLRSLLRGRQALEADGGTMPALLLLVPDAHDAQRWQALNARTAMERWLARPLDGGILVVPPPWQNGDRASKRAQIANERSCHRVEVASLWQANWLSLSDSGSRRLAALLTPATEPPLPALSTVPPVATSGHRHLTRPGRAAKVIGHFNERADRWAESEAWRGEPGRSPVAGGGRRGHGPAPRSGREALALLALRLDACHDAVLAILATHPLLSGEELAAVLGITSTSAGVYLRHLHRLGLVVPATDLSLVDMPAIPADIRRLHGRYALTVLGIQLATAQSGRTVKGVPRADGQDLPCGDVHYSAYDREVAALMRVPAHTAGVYQFVASLYHAASIARTRCQAQRVVWWESGRACTRQYREVDGWHALRPDAAGEYMAGTHRLRFWLEWDRGTMRRRDLVAKFAAYAHYVRSREWRADGNVPLPDLLVVTSDYAHETWFAQALDAVPQLDRALHPLQIRITTADRLSSSGAFAPIWRSWIPGAPHTVGHSGGRERTGRLGHAQALFDELLPGD